MVVATWPLHAQITISTNRYDGARTGANLSETRLTAANVNVANFGKLYSYAVDGSVYAQPLYIPGVTIGGVARNVLYVATMNDKVYAFDADRAGAPLWSRDFTSPPSVTPVPIGDLVAPNKNIIGNVGIQSTPVIDTATGTIYLVARTKENGSYVQRLHALDIATGASRAGSPVTITGAVSGTAPDAGPGLHGPVVTFNPKMQAQRAALALSNGVVLIAWAGHEDVPPYHGWIMGYDAATLAQVAVFCVTPDAYAGGIWQGGRGPTLDAAGNAYFVTGNGRWDGTRNFGNSVLKFGVSRDGLTLLDYFTPGNQEALSAADDDLSGSSFTLLPGTNLLLGGGKEGVLYLLNAGSLGRMTPDDGQIPQRIDVHAGHVMGGPVFWNSNTLGPMIYHWAEDDVLKAYRFNGGRLALPPYAEGAMLSPGHPGGSLTVSANGGAAGSGIIWSSLPANQDGLHGLVSGILRAFDAETLLEIWNSEEDAARDRVGTLMKFVPPVVVNGRVYMPSHDNSVAVYGLLAGGPPVGPAPAGTISIDFVGSNATAMGADETAGVVATRNWNAAWGAAESAPQPLVDSTGAATSATVTWSASGTWQLPTADQPGNARMMKGYLDTTSTGMTTVSVAGLPAGSYDVYVYTDGDNKVYERSAAYTIRAPGIAATTVVATDLATANFGGSFSRASGSAGNYVRFRIAASAFTIEAVPTLPESGTRRAPINGIQIVPAAPAPAPDFTVTESPHRRTVTRGSAATYSVTVAGVNGFTGQVSLSASDVPAGTTATFAPATISGSGSATLTLATTASTPTGTFTVHVTGTSGSTTRSTHVMLTVEAPPAAGAGTISVDFVGSSTAVMGPGETAGVVPAASWNSAAGAAQADPQPLVDNAGAATGATLTWFSPAGTWALPIADQPGSARMMRGYLDTSTTSTTTLSVAGLAPGSYDVYVYADGDNRAFDRGALYTLSGPGLATTTIALTDAASTNFAGTFTRADGSAGNYVRFSITGTAFTITAQPATPEGGTRRAPVNGLQIVRTSAPPPDPPAAGIGIDFSGNSGAVMAPDDRAGVVPQANWNDAPGAASAAALALLDATGAATSASVTWRANGAWSLPIDDAPGDMRLMRGYLDTSSTSVTTVTVTGLPSRTYDVYVYADGDNRAYSRSGVYRLTPAGGAGTDVGATDPPGANFSGTFVEAAGGSGNYVKFTVTGSGFTVTATPSSASPGASLRAPLNAIQIVPR